MRHHNENCRSSSPIASPVVCILNMKEKKKKKKKGVYWSLEVGNELSLIKRKT